MANMSDIITYDDWNILSTEEKTVLFNNLKEKAMYKNRTYLTNKINENYIEPKEVTRGHIYRRFKQLTDSFKEYKSYLDTNFPNGEILEFHDKEMNYSNYTILYNWVNGNCLYCSNHSLEWETRNNKIGYYCTNCSSETLFVDSAFKSRCPPEISY